MKKKISDALRKPFKAGSSSSSTTPLSDILQGITNNPPHFDLISHCIEEALREIPAESKDEFQSDSRLAFMLDAGSKVLNNLEDTADKIKKQASPDGLSLIAKMLESTGKTHYVGLCFSVMAVALNSYKTSSNNRTECRKLLQTAIKLIGHLKELSSSRSFFISHEKELKNAVSWLLYTAIRIISMTHRSRASRFLYALIDKKDLDTIHREVHETFPQLCLSTTISLLNHVEEERYYKPEYQQPSNIVGMDSQIEEVMKDLDIKQGRGGCTCVCIHAMGGAGKSTLADSVYFMLSQQLEGYYHCKVELNLDETATTLLERQKEILEKLLGSKLPQKIGNKEDGKYMMKDEIKKLKKPVFILLDNLNLSLEQVQFVVPSFDVFKSGSAILVTTRYKRIEHSLQRLGFTPLMKEVLLLKDEEARKLLYQSMGCDPQMDVHERVREKCERELLRACCGLPLALKVVGGIISANDGLKKEQVWQDIVQSLREGRSISGDAEEKDTLLLCLKFSIDALSSKLRDSFFDIIAFFNNKSWWFVAYAVGNEAMEELKARHLIQAQKLNINTDNHRYMHDISEITSSLTTTQVKVHDVLHGLGKRMMEEKGEVVIRNPDEFQFLDSMKLPNIRGICLTPIDLGRIDLYEEEVSSIAWSRLCRMENIRVLSGVVVEGHQFIKPLKSLRVLFLQGHGSELPFALENAPNLNLLEGKSIDMQQMKIPKGLKYLWLQNCPCLPSFENCQLEYLALNNCHNLMKLEGIQHLRCLKHLLIYQCNKLREVEDLPALQSLNIAFCENIKHIISCNFSALRALKLFFCTHLKEIPFDMENVHYLRIENCERLEHISDVLNFTHVSCFFIQDTNVKQLPLPQLHWTHQQPPYLSLRHVSLSRSEHLKELPKVFFCSSPNLETLDLSYCKNLISLPKDNCRGVNSQLRLLRLRGCKSLETLDVSNLSRLQKLDVSSSTNLITCSISELQPVQILNFSECPKLESLRSMSILSLRYLNKLRLNGCWKVKKEVEDILQHVPPSMEEIDVRGCLNMEEVEECFGDKRLDVKVLSEPSSWSNEMSKEEKMQKMSEVLQSLYFMDSMDNIIPGTHLQGNLVCLLFIRYNVEKVLENANALHSELENAGKELRFIYICSQQSIQIILEHGIKVSPYHTSSLLSIYNEIDRCYTSDMLITTVGNGCAHVLSDARVLWKQFGLEGYPFTRDALAKVAKPLTLSSFLRTQTTFSFHNDPHRSQVTPNQLTGKLVVLYFSLNPIPFFTQHTHAGEQLEFIWILDERYSPAHEAPKGQLVLKMNRFAQKQWYSYGGLLKQIAIKEDPKVFVFDKQGNLLCPNAWEACMRYGVANAFPFTPNKIASLPDQPFLNSPLHFLLCNTKLHTATLPTTKVSLQSLEGTVACFVMICVGSQQSLEMVVKDYQNLKGEWKEQVQIVCLLDDNLKVQTTLAIPHTWLIADLSCFFERCGFWMKEDKKTQLPKFLRNNNCWCLGFDGEGELIREGVDARLFARYLLEELQVYNEEDVEDDDRSSIIRNEVGTMSLNLKITKGWEIPSPINHPQHQTCQLYVCLRNCICDICEQREKGWTYFCLSCDFDMCLDCHAKM